MIHEVSPSPTEPPAPGDRPLSEDQLAASWLDQLQSWYAEAVACGAIVEPNAVQLATATPTGTPSVRTVLIKAMDEQGLVFYTGYDSAKGQDLAANPVAAAVFAWLPLARQVRLTGAVEPISPDETDEYFATRPRGSQLGAWASPQSQVIPSRAVLDAAVHQATVRFGAGPVPTPTRWGGFRLRPDAVEFWQGRVDRLHDRLRYRRAGEVWVVERLAP
jgi:pyridoxamine 5'-phosphate oxidase